MSSDQAEKSHLLPVAVSHGVVTHHSQPRPGRQVHLTEIFILTLSLFLAAFQLFTLYPFDEIPTLSENASFLDYIALGLPIAIPATLPAALVLGIAAPYIAREDRVAVTRYMVLLCFLVGSTLGGALFGREVNRASRY